MKIDPLLTDAAVLAELGGRLARQRLELGLTQAQVAERAGVAKRTLERLEAGESSQLTSFIRILRVLDRLEVLEHLLPDAGSGPMALLRGKGKVRQRAPRRRARPPEEDWTWGDEP